jgi:hypothetical protein
VAVTSRKQLAARQLFESAGQSHFGRAGFDSNIVQEQSYPLDERFTAKTNSDTISTVFEH